MPFINLIQEQRLAALRLERQARISFFSFAGAALATVGGYGFLLFMNTSSAGEEARLRADRQKLAPVVEQIEANQNQLSTLEPRLKTLEDAQLISSRWSRILAHLKHQMPPHTWLTSIRCTATDPAQPIGVSFHGMGMAQNPIAEFILRMQNAEDLENVNLRFTAEKLVQNTKGIEFEVAGTIVGTAEQKPKNNTDDEEKA